MWNANSNFKTGRTCKRMAFLGGLKMSSKSECAFQENNFQNPSELMPPFAEKLFSTLGRKRALLVLLLLQKQKKLRNKDLVKKLGGISPSTLSLLLRELHSEGLIKKKIYGEIPPLSVEYRLSGDGKYLLSVLEPILKLVEKPKIS